MYLEFFKFKKNPFHITPDPEFLFLSPSHKEASASIFYGIEARKGFVAVTGEVGVGKTTVLRSYLDGTDREKIRIVYIFNAALSFEKLLKQICCELGILAGGEDPAELAQLLFHYLIEEYGKDRNVVLIIDEAQNMPVETLERLRMLSNLETSQDKLIQLILVGQPEFEAKLDLPELRQLKQRIAIRARVAALTADESAAYIHHRLMKASLFHNPVFTKKALKLIIKHAGGIPRTINILCDNALVTAFGYGCRPVSEKIVKEVIGDFRGKQPRSGFPWRIIWVPAVAACFAAAVFVAPNHMSSREHRASAKRYVETGLRKPLPAAAVTVKKPKSVCAIDTGPGARKVPVAAGVDQGVAMGSKSNAGLAVDDAKHSGTGTAEGAKEAAAAAEPAVVSAPAGKSGPAGPGGPVAVTVKKPKSVCAIDTGPGARKVPVAAGVDQGVARGSKSNAGLAVDDAKHSGTAEGAKEAAAGNKPPVKKRPGMDPPAARPPVQPSKSALERESGHPVTVKEGDTVSKLLIGIYGKAGINMLGSFKELNPQIRDINRIRVGEKIILP